MAAGPLKHDQLKVSSPIYEECTLLYHIGQSFPSLQLIDEVAFVPQGSQARLNSDYLSVNYFIR